VGRLPIVEIEKKHCKQASDGKMEHPTCPICMDELKIGKKAIFMPCGHTFDPDCLLPWLKDHNTCPVCRYELPVQQ